MSKKIQLDMDVLGPIGQTLLGKHQPNEVRQRIANNMENFVENLSPKQTKKDKLDYLREFVRLRRTLMERPTIGYIRKCVCEDINWLADHAHLLTNAEKYFILGPVITALDLSYKAIERRWIKTAMLIDRARNLLEVSLTQAQNQPAAAGRG